MMKILMDISDSIKTNNTSYLALVYFQKYSGKYHVYSFILYSERWNFKIAIKLIKNVHRWL